MSVVLRWPAKLWDKKSKLMCRLFGHVWKRGWWGDMPYLKPTAGPVDGVNRHHISLRCKCDRCGNESHIAYVHDWSEPFLGSKEHHLTKPSQSSR